MTKNDEIFMRRAIELAQIGVDKGAGGPFGAVVVKNGEIVGEGYNRVTSTNDPTAHAEVVAIRNACAKLESFQLDDCVLYTSCEPCPMCLGAIYWARPKEIFYAATHTDAANAGHCKWATQSIATIRSFTKKSSCPSKKQKSKASIFCAKKVSRRSKTGRTNRIKRNTDLMVNGGW